MDSKTETEIVEKYRHATNRLVLLDYDGTLVSHTSFPDTASLPEDIADIILKLVQNPLTKIFIISGRGYTDIEKFLNHIPISIIAEHGAMIRDGGAWKKQIINNSAWKKVIIPILEQITSTCPNSYVEEKSYSLTWHYRDTEPALGYSRSRELIGIMKKIVPSYNLKILDGNKVVELLTNETGKGKAVKKLIEQNSYDFVLSIGDDATDEEMFDYFLDQSNAVTIKVGEGSTHARYKVNTISEVASLLKHLSG
jgi:trehalose 6-phosphate synthase/phosphatase